MLLPLVVSLSNHEPAQRGSIARPSTGYEERAGIGRSSSGWGERV